MAYITRVLLIGVLLGVGCAGEPNSVECETGITCPTGTICAAVQPICLTNPCGDGIQQSTEVCDDGNILDGDGCARDCASREVCGDSVLNNSAGEICDDGNTDGGDGCASDCRSVEVCGNNIRDVNEACDDGNTLPGDGCSGNCKSTEVCGNNIVDLNEKCDDGGTAGGCNDDCQGGTGCGDGAIDRDGSGNALEECDDGNADNTDDCLKIPMGAGFVCRLARCGDGVVNSTGTPALREGCDPSVNFVETDTCNLDCTVSACGDNKLNNEAGEECDPGPLLIADDRDCTAACKVNVCGDGLPNTVGPNNIEGCDDMNTNQTDGCSNQCTVPACGNGVVESTEACDDFNTTSGDGCSFPGCDFESCHDGVVNNGEECDPGVALETAKVGQTPGCNSDCTFSDCGDGRVNAVDGEQCDDRNTMDTGDACRNNCKLNVCGDNSKSGTEACDDGNAVNNDGCSTSCTTAACPNGIVDAGEQCDDGNMTDTDGCLPSCVYATCGDGKVRAGVEECDNGTSGNGFDKNCLPNCKLNVCGDGHKDLESTRIEDCDDGNMITEAECPYGISTCKVCKDDCTQEFDRTGNVCGDGPPAISPETCDDGNNITDAECPYNSPNGACNVCNSTCSGLVARTGGPFCGDKDTDTAFGEACDDGSPTQTCGTCNNTCSVSSAAATATGVIVAPTVTGGLDGETFVINDGDGHTHTFEFDTNGTFTSTTTVEVDIPGGSTPTQVREAIEAAIDGTDLEIDTDDLGSAAILLTAQNPGARANQPITTSVTSTAFYVSGMSGGAARDCGAGVPCRFNSDCYSGVCVGALGTCQL